DVWAMGVILYEMLTGTKPFQSDTGLAVVRLILDGEFQRLRALKSHLPMSYEVLVKLSLNVDPQWRYKNASALRKACEGILTGDSGTHSTWQTGLYLKDLGTQKSSRLILTLIVVIILAAFGAHRIYRHW